tara:strand:- start:88759 stop:89706 length:948 start_codon:yes stop_codon:yes gene_type:complete
MPAELVSVIVPTFNRLGTLPETITSVFSQTHRPIQLIVVDDGSTDGTREYLNSIVPESGCDLIVQCQQQAGAQVARNQGFRRSSGSYIQFLDSDDVLGDTKLARQIEVMKQSHAELCFCKSGIIRNNEIDFETSYFPTPSGISHVRDLLVNITFNTVCGLYTRSVIDRSGLWDERLEVWQDLEFNLKILLNAHNVQYLNEFLCAYRIDSADSVSKSGASLEGSKRRLRTVAKIEQLLMQNTVFGVEEREWLASRYRGLAEHALRSGDNEVAIESFRRAGDFSSSVWKQWFCRIGAYHPKLACKVRTLIGSGVSLK